MLRIGTWWCRLSQFRVEFLFHLRFLEAVSPMVSLKEAANQLPSRVPGTSSLTSAGPQSRGSLDHGYVPRYTGHVHAGSSGPGIRTACTGRQHLCLPIRQLPAAQQHKILFLSHHCSRRKVQT